MTAATKSAPHSDPILDVSYLSLRKAIGWIGIVMPWVARGYAKFESGTPFLMSISAYYHTPGRDIFVGSLFAAGLFLGFYRGSHNSIQDRILAILWGISAALIGLIPMNPCGDRELMAISSNLECKQTYHFIPVAVFFAINIYMALFRFTKPSQPHVTEKKPKRNKIYIACGVVMLGSVLAIWYCDHYSLSVFIPEAVAIAAFGVAWLVKGQIILADEDAGQPAAARAASPGA